MSSISSLINPVFTMAHVTELEFDTANLHWRTVVGSAPDLPNSTTNNYTELLSF